MKLQFTKQKFYIRLFLLFSFVSRRKCGKYQMGRLGGNIPLLEAVGEREIEDTFLLQKRKTAYMRYE